MNSSLRPQPVPHVPVGTEAEVCADIAHRQKLGIAKYGTTVAENPLSLEAWLQHAYEETLDQAIYLKRAISEIKQRRLNTESDDPRLAAARQSQPSAATPA